MRVKLDGGKWAEVHVDPADVAAFRRHCRGLERILYKVQVAAPQANYYLAVDGLHLMAGPSHVDQGTTCVENSVASQSIGLASGGDW